MERDEIFETMDWVVAQVRGLLLKGLRADFSRSNGNPEFTPDLSKQSLKGYCGFAQCAAAYVLHDMGVEVKAVAIQSLPETAHGHVFLTAAIPLASGGKQWLLLDPTFKQFCGPGPAPDSASQNHEISPGFYMQMQADGEARRNQLLSKGYLPLTHENAGHYLAAFCRGLNPLKSDDEAFSFLTDPPSSKMNYWFSREELASKGYGIKALSTTPENG